MIYEAFFHLTDSDKSEAYFLIKSEVLDAKTDGEAVKETLDLLSEYKHGVIGSCYIKHGEKLIYVR